MAETPPSLDDVRLRRYTREIALLPWPSPRVHRDLVHRATTGSRSAHEALRAAYLPFVATLARRHLVRGRGPSELELVLEGNVGLTHALIRFDPGAGCRLVTYARVWILRALDDAHDRRDPRIAWPPELMERVLAWPACPGTSRHIGKVSGRPGLPTPPGSGDRALDAEAAPAGLEALAVASPVVDALDARDRRVLTLRPALCGRGEDEEGLASEIRRTHECARQLEREAMASLQRAMQNPP